MQKVRGKINESTDHLENVIIRNNLIDVRNSEMSPTGNGIVVQATSSTTYVGPILIEKNTIIGGETQGTITNVLSNGKQASQNARPTELHTHQWESMCHGCPGQERFSGSFPTIIAAVWN